ncbi:MAG: hypothetical protein WD897_00260, partial [Parcubacteria group bacterium]
YFGPLTRAAVAQWQAANGITPAVGYFGPISRASFAANATKTEAPSISVAPAAPIPSPVAPVMPAPVAPFMGFENDTPRAPGMRANRVMLFRAHPFEVRPGDPITLDGSSFSKTINNVSFNGGSQVTATSTNGSVLKINVPSSLSDGEYRLAVSNALGSSDDPNINVSIKVTNNPHPGPFIESASIDGENVTLVGSGFTLANELITTFGNSAGPVSANGTTLTFRIPDLSMYDKIRQFTAGSYRAALWIYVQNEHGINKDPYRLETTI